MAASQDNQQLATHMLELANRLDVDALRACFRVASLQTLQLFEKHLHQSLVEVSSDLLELIFTLLYGTHTRGMSLLQISELEEAQHGIRTASILQYCQENGLPVDSWHHYTCDPAALCACTSFAKITSQELEKIFQKPPSHRKKRL